MKSPCVDLELLPDGGLAALPELRRQPRAGAERAEGTRFRAVVADPNDARLERMLSTDHRVFGVKTPFVGRRDALETLYNSVRDAVTRKRLGVVRVIGGPGIGKTRLLAEVFAIVDPIARGIRILPAAASAGAGERSSAVVAQLVRRRFGVAPGERDVVAREKILQGIEPLVDARALGTSARSLSYLAGLRALGLQISAPGDMAQFRRDARRTFAELLRDDAEREPQVLVVHRAHLLSVGSVEFFATLVDVVAERPVALMLVGHGGMPAIPGVRDEDITDVRLGPLEARDMGRLVRALLERVEGLPDDLVAEVAAGSAGSPRLAEENVRLLVQRGVVEPQGEVWRLDAGRLPVGAGLVSTLEAACRARLVALEPADRRLLERASVFGYAFWRRGLVNLERGLGGSGGRPRAPWVVDEAADRVTERLEALTADGMLRRQESTLDGDVELAFAHDEDRDALYAEIPVAFRALGHRLAAQWLRRHAPEGSGAWQEVIGNHWEAGERPDAAARALLEAADGARDGLATRRASALYRRALQLVDSDRGALLVSVLARLGDLALRTGELQEARAAYGAMLEASRLVDDPAAGAQAWLSLGKAYLGLGDYVRARACVGYARDLYRRQDDALGGAGAMDLLARVVWLEGGPGGLEEAWCFATEALDLRRRAAPARPVADSLGNLANIEILRGRYDAAREHLEEALELRRQVGDMAGEATVGVGLGAVRYAAGDLDGAVAAWTNGLDLAFQVGDRELVGAFLNNLGEAALDQGDAERAEGLLVEAQRVTAETGDQRTAADVVRNLAAVAAALGRFDEALDRANEAHEVAETLGSGSVVAQVLRTRGVVLSLQSAAGSGAEVAGTSCLSEAAARFEELGDQMELARTLRAWAEHHRRHGDEAAALEVEARLTPR